jgi:hypothetical protein
MDASWIEVARSYKIPGTKGMVFFDWAATVLLALVISSAGGFGFVLVLCLLLLLSVLLHVVFHVDTVTNYHLGLSKLPSKLPSKK